MKKGIMLPFLIALFAAAIYMFLLHNAEQKLNAAKSMKTVVVTMRDIKEREVIKKDYLRTVKVPAAYVQKDAFTYNNSSDIDKLENTIARIQISKGNQLSKYAVTSLSPETGLSSKIPPKMRGYVLTVDNNLASMIKPNDNVDILITFEAMMKNGARERVTMTLLQTIKVLGVGSNLGQGLDAKSAAALKNKEEEDSAYTDVSALSLALSPRDVQYLALAQKEGDLSVVLRGPGDMNMYQMEIATFSKLFK